jgi:hypothetical protein
MKFASLLFWTVLLFLVYAVIVQNLGWLSGRFARPWATGGRQPERKPSIPVYIIGIGMACFTQGLVVAAAAYPNTDNGGRIIAAVEVVLAALYAVRVWKTPRIVA